MPTAFLPSPTRAVWHLGPLPVRAYALCLVGGIVLGVWVASRRYVQAGGRPGVILDVAAWAVPCGLVGARLYSVITDYERYFGAGHDWLAMVKVSDGALGFPGALAAGSAAAWLACRRAGVTLAPVAGAAGPGERRRAPPRPSGRPCHICGVSGPRPSGQVCTRSAICM